MTQPKEETGYTCSACDRLYRSGMFGGDRDTARRMAAECCAPRRCEEHGLDIGIGYTECAACRRQAEEKREALRVAKATKVAFADYRGSMLYSEHWSSELTSEEYQHTEDVDVLIADGGPVGTTYAWACKEREVRFDLSERLEDFMLDQHHEDAWDFVDLEKVAAAEVLIDQVLADILSYDPDYTTVVILNKEEI